MKNTWTYMREFHQKYTTYLGIVDKETKNKLRAEESFLISEHEYTSGRLLDGTECQLLLDMGASKSFMSKSFYM